MDGAGRSAVNGDDAAAKDRLIAELREAVEARDEFVAIAAHELRNPMTPILMQVDILSRAVRDPSRCQPEILGPKLDVLATAVNEFVRRATVLLDASRIAAGNVRIESSVVDLSTLVATAIEDASNAAERSRCPLIADIHPDIVGYWDHLALQQVVENLLSNAIKFGAGHAVSVTLRAEGGQACLSVRDRGIGIADEDRERIFQRFERAVARREHGGFGIGLWLAHQLVTAMGGSIAADRAPDQGSIFVVKMPLGGMEADMTGSK